MTRTIGQFIVISALLTLALLDSAAQARRDDVPPHPIYDPEPEFSEAARMANFQGTCVLRILVGKDGTVHNVRIERPLGMGLDQNAVEAVRTWRFEPALKNGNPVDYEGTVEVTYRFLNRDKARQALLNALPPQIDRPISTTVEPCPAPLPRNSGAQPQVVVAEIVFEGELQLPAVDQDQIAASIKNREYSGSPASVRDEVVELLREAWQDHGYYKVQVNDDFTVLSSNPVSSRIAVSARIDEGEQYRLGEITFTNNRSIPNTRALRDLFPIKDGDVFNREKIATGLVNLRKAYGAEGYINATFFPTPQVDENERIVSFEIGVDDGKQFYVNSINIIGENEEVLAEATQSLFLKVGQLYNQNLIDLMLKNYPVAASDSTVLHLNLKQGTADVTVELRHCQQPLGPKPSSLLAAPVRCTAERFARPSLREIKRA